MGNFNREFPADGAIPAVPEAPRKTVTTELHHHEVGLSSPGGGVSTGMVDLSDQGIRPKNQAVKGQAWGEQPDQLQASPKARSYHPLRQDQQRSAL